jgi:hypothetical protein
MLQHGGNMTRLTVPIPHIRFWYDPGGFARTTLRAVDVRTVLAMPIGFFCALSAIVRHRLRMSNARCGYKYSG